MCVYTKLYTYVCVCATVCRLVENSSVEIMNQVRQGGRGEIRK